MNLTLKHVLGGGLLIAAIIALPAMGQTKGRGPCAQGAQARGLNGPAGGPQRLMEKFDVIDVDGDGALSREELQVFFETRVADNGDRPFRGGRKGHCGERGRNRGEQRGDAVGRMLDRMERADAASETEGYGLAVFSKIDANGDSVIDETEWETFAADRGDRMRQRLARVAPAADTNADGTLDDVEVAALKAQRLERMQERILERHPEADTDADGVISEAEFQAFKATVADGRRAQLLERHPEADTDGDGVISEAEAKAFFQSHRRPGGPGRGPHRGPKPVDDGGDTNE